MIHKCEIETAKWKLTQQQRSHSNRMTICWMPSCVMLIVKLGELDLMLELKLPMGVNKMQLRDVEEWDSDFQVLL